MRTELRHIAKGLECGIRGEGGMIVGAIQRSAEKRTPSVVKKLGCIAPIFTTIVGTASLIKGAILASNYENGVVYLATGIGLLYFSLVNPIVRRFLNR